MSASHRIVAWAGVSLDGHSSGPGGPAHGTWLHDLRLFVVPVLVGSGLRLFPDGVDARFTTAGVTALANGVIGLHLTRP